MSAYKLRTVEICGFRGIGSKQVIDFSYPVTLLHGNNRQGKSSILNAIEWCLFGSDVAAIKYGDIRERDGWEVKNLTSKTCYVKCHFQDEAGTSLFAKRIHKSAKNSQFEFEIPDLKQGNDAKEFLALLQVSPQDFLASVHLHPEVTRNLIVAKPKERKEAIDRLLGLSGSRDIVDALLAAKPSQWTGELDRQIALINAQLQAHLEEKKETIDRESEVLLQKGLPEVDLSCQGAITHASQLLVSVNAFAAEYQLSLPDVISPSSFTDVPIARKGLVSAVQQLRSQHPILKDRGIFLAKRNRLEGLRTSYVAQKQIVTAAENDLGSYPEKRSEEELEAASLCQQGQVKALEGEMLLVSRNGKVLSDALDFFKGKAENSTAPCPLCGVETKSISEWRLHIESELVSKNLKPLEEQKASLLQSIAALQASCREITALKANLAGHRKVLAGQLEAIESALNKKLDPNDDPLAILNIEIDILSATLTALVSQVASINAELADFEAQIKDLDQLERIGRAQQEMEQIEGIANHPQYQELKALRGKADQCAQDIELMIEGVTASIKKEAEKRLTSAQKAISSNFSKITKRPDYPELKVAVNSDGYGIEVTNPSESQKAVPILNHADLNCCALSIFLALAGSPQITHNLGFIILDDPTQSFDRRTRKNLCDVLDGLAGSRQIIVATADEGLAADLQAITKNKASYLLNNWEPSQGPTINKTN